MVNLVNNTEKLELITSSASSIAVVASGVTTASGSTTGVFSEEVVIAAVQTTDIIAAPTTGEKIVTSVFVRNQGAVSNTITFQKDVSGTEFPISAAIPLAAGESCLLDKNDNIIVYDVEGKPKLGIGEPNTITNVGNAGVGVFKQKVGVNLELKKINAGSAKVTITDDTVNSEVDVDVITGTTAATVCVGNDARLSDSRNPLPHTHAQSDIINLDTEFAKKLNSVDIKKSGQIFRSGNGQVLEGLCSGMLLTGTIVNGTRDTDGKHFQHDTNVDIDSQAGYREATEAETYRRAEGCYVKVKFKMVSTTTTRLFMGFIGSTALVPVGDDPLNALNGFGLCIISTSANYQIALNDGVDATVFVDTGVAWANTNLVTIELKADAADTGFQWAINGGTFSSVITTNAPASTANLAYQHTITTNQILTAKSFSIYYVRTENQK